MGRYQLRSAVGKYWVLDMEQKGDVYKRPMTLNSIGAVIFKGLEAGQTVQQIAETIHQEYEGNIEEIKEDILQFQKQLMLNGITFEGEEHDR